METEDPGTTLRISPLSTPHPTLPHTLLRGFVCMSDPSLKSTYAGEVGGLTVPDTKAYYQL